jgi:hypothetical protein
LLVSGPSIAAVSRIGATVTYTDTSRRIRRWPALRRDIPRLGHRPDDAIQTE